MPSTVKAALLLLAASLLQSCQPSRLIMRAQISGGHLSISFYKRGIFGNEYRVRPCVRQAILETADQRIIWHIFAPPEPPSWRPCRELRELQPVEIPAGFEVRVPFDSVNARGSAILSVSSVEGGGHISVDLGTLKAGQRAFRAVVIADEPG